ncbi:MAG: glycosyltransferase family 4 protein [Acidimicrobiales bacterium]
MPADPCVLLVGHDASRTGAPLVAAELVAWAAATTAAPWRVALLRGGPLAARYAASVPTSLPGAVEARLGRAAGPGAAALRLRREAASFDEAPVVVANTVAAWAAAATVRRRRALVCWVHELDGVADAVVPATRRAALVAETDRFVAAGARVAAMLVDRWGVPAGRVRVADPFVAAPPEAPAGCEVRVLDAGSLVARKGADLFVDVVAGLAGSGPMAPGAAAWVGGPLEGPHAELVRHERRAAGLEEVLALPGPAPDLEAWWPRAGIVVHPAREDPAPLVVLEAALRGVPTVTWDTGGAADLLREAGCGHLVAPAGDLLGLVARARDLLADPQRRDEAGRALQAIAGRRTTERAAPATFDALVGGR